MIALGGRWIRYYYYAWSFGGLTVTGEKLASHDRDIS